MAKSRIGSLNAQERKLTSAIKKAQLKAAKKREVLQKKKTVESLRKKLNGLKK